MNITTFKSTLHQDTPPAGLKPAVRALWFDANNDWQKAHLEVDHLTDATAMHIHAYLHRKEGDMWNAGYWYSRANQEMSKSSLAEEWEQLCRLYLEKD